MVLGWIVGVKWRNAGDQIGQYPYLNAALEDCDSDIEWRHLVCKALLQILIYCLEEGFDRYSSRHNNRLMPILRHSILQGQVFRYVRLLFH